MEDPKTIIPLKREEGIIYDFGVPRVSEKMQKQYLLKAAEFEEFDNIAHRISHSRYEKSPSDGIPSGIKTGKIDEFRKGRPFGYCKSSECRKLSRAKWAAQFGAEIGYNCVDCLTSFIFQARGNLRGSNISVIFHCDDEQLGPKAEINRTTGMLILEFTEMGVSVNNTKPLLYKFTTSEEKSTCEIYGIPTPLKSIITPGESYIGTIKGRHVCENIILGKTCLSMAPDYTPSTFLAKSIPPGVPGWGEGKDTRDAKKCGKISIYKFCPACAIQHQNKQNSWSKREEPPQKIEQNEAAYWKKKYVELQMENTELRIQIAELQQAKVKQQMN